MGLDEACAPEDGLICEDSLICSSGNVCAQSSVVGEGERCSRDGVRMCESNFACEFIDQLGPFCLPIETLPEGAICDPSDPLALCETDFVCLSENGGVPRCVALSPACPEDWQVIPLDELPMYTAAANTDDSGILSFLSA